MRCIIDPANFIRITMEITKLILRFESQIVKNEYSPLMSLLYDLVIRGNIEHVF
jgi:hypothetical protein